MIGERDSKFSSKALDKSVLLAVIPISIGVVSGYFAGKIVSGLSESLRLVCAFGYFLSLGYFVLWFNFRFFSHNVRKLNGMALHVVNTHFQKMKNRGPVIVWHSGMVFSAMLFAAGYMIDNKIVIAASIAIWWISDKYIGDSLEKRFVSKEVALRSVAS